MKENVILSNQSRSSEKFVHGIKVLMAKNYIDNLSEEVRKGLHTKAAQGLWPSFAALGYVNTDGPDGKRIIVPDPVLGPMTANLFLWFATGEYSIKALAKKGYEEGFRFRKSKNRIPVTTLHKILRNRIYTAEFEYAGTVYQGVHEPLVGREAWARKSWTVATRERTVRSNTISHSRASLDAATVDVRWSVRSRKDATCTTIALDTAGSAQSRTLAKKS